MAKWLKLLWYTFHQTWLMSLHYLVKHDVLIFLPNTGLIAIRLLSFGVNVKRAYCRGDFLLRSHCQTLAGCLETIFFVSTGRRPDASSTRLRCFPGQRENARNASSSISVVSVYAAYFEHKFWQFWPDLSWQLITLPIKPYFSLLCANLVVRWFVANNAFQRYVTI